MNQAKIDPIIGKILIVKYGSQTSIKVNKILLGS